ncbi:hypothetical protein [Mesorhizobium sp. M0579]|uniref:hypothetical protein n=1 Tax=Mesorhizobium sp. M0579 TaxID=2956962 RepID=UPI00333CD752
MKTTRKKKVQDRDDLVRKIVERKYPRFSALCYAILDELEEIDESDPDAVRLAIRNEALSPSNVLSNDDRKTLNEALDWQNQLQQKSQAQLRFIINEDYAAFQASLDAAEEDRWLFFNESRSAADFRLWSQMATWSVEEAVSLSLGKMPDVVNSNSLSKLNVRSPFADRYLRLRAIVHRAVGAGLLGTSADSANPINPELFLRWAKGAGIEVPAQLEVEVEVRRTAMGAGDNALTALKNEREALKNERDELARTVSQLTNQLKQKEVRQRERKTLLAMVYLMGKKYRYDFKKARSGSVKNIQDALRYEKFEISDETILAKLRDASRLQEEAVKRYEKEAGLLP